METFDGKDLIGNENVEFSGFQSIVDLSTSKPKLKNNKPSSKKKVAKKEIKKISNDNTDDIKKNTLKKIDDDDEPLIKKGDSLDDIDKAVKKGVVKFSKKTLDNVQKKLDTKLEEYVNKDYYPTEEVKEVSDIDMLLFNINSI